jgi:hypothetical protein
MRTDIKIELEEVKVTVSKANRGKIKDVTEPYKWAQRVKAVHVPTASQCRISDVV